MFNFVLYKFDYYRPPQGIFSIPEYTEKALKCIHSFSAVYFLGPCSISHCCAGCAPLFFNHIARLFTRALFCAPAAAAAAGKAMP